MAVSLNKNAARIKLSIKQLSLGGNIIDLEFDRSNKSK